MSVAANPPRHPPRLCPRIVNTIPSTKKKGKADKLMMKSFGAPTFSDMRTIAMKVANRNNNEMQKEQADIACETRLNGEVSSLFLCFIMALLVLLSVMLTMVLGGVWVGLFEFSPVEFSPVILGFSIAIIVVLSVAMKALLDRKEQAAGPSRDAEGE